MPHSTVETSPDSSVWQAAKTGNVALLQSLVDAGASFHAHDAFNATPFQHGCMAGHPRVVRYLLGLYVLHKLEIPSLELEVCKRGCTNDELRKYLQGQQTIDQAIANDDETKRVDELTIWDAAKEGKISKVKLLHCRGPVTAVDGDGHTALYHACVCDQYASIILLVGRFKATMANDDFAAEMHKCCAATTNAMVHGLLDGTLTMRDVMALGKKKKQSENKKKKETKAAAPVVVCSTKDTSGQGETAAAAAAEPTNGISLLHSALDFGFN
ncbi:Aste57867_14869 [Aphanomyces stellatus]|uniref:Aste57867_14869 protein n=1 Tax=Aphanomyces stellatus TaxID=120398 RepID=A0A485L1T2_9STRA|nr:hypothetical protein As57867_014813 [Aphanomyces stellatus]VFT91686.1 Aste57867_14869 [Aphanomyces stellatus]